jgi:asparagine synthase (glutamine-hydrolysing)
VQLLDGGIVLGRFHRRQGALESAVSWDTLMEQGWGGYVALSEAAGTARLLRAPLGDLPCYWVEVANGLVAASSPRLALAGAGRDPAIAWAALARHLAFGTISTSETCLDAVRDLRGGDELAVASGPIVKATRWSPWTFARLQTDPSGPKVLADRLRGVVLDCVSKAVAGHSKLLLKLSGGLDSSIVAAALAARGHAFESLTLFTDDPAGDERHHARTVAEHLGIDLRESRRDPLRLDFGRSPSASLARPSFPGFRQEADRLADASAARLGATAVVDGGGGDNVFCSVQSASAVADCLRDPRGMLALGSTARSVGMIAQVSVAHVLRNALQRAISPRRSYRWPRDLLFLSDDAAAFVPGQPDHPWLTAPRGVPPGRAAHVALIAAAQSYVEGLDSEHVPPTLSPLLAQPIVELCLSVPSWLWVEDGLNRALARQAFADDLPPSIIRRHSKGSPECFVAQAFEVHRHLIREMLLGGALADARLVDTCALARVLDGRGPASDWSLDRIMILLDAEIWVRGWAS